MAGGQQITSAQGTLIAEGGDGTVAVTGEASASAQGDVAKNRLIPLRSKKIGGGTASAVLSGSVISGATGSLGKNYLRTPTGLSITGGQGTLAYRGQATISWNPVTTNQDGSPLTDLAGYRILHGTAPTVYSESVTLGIVTSYVWTGLLPGMTHYFVVQAFDANNNFSGNSAEVSKTF